MHWSCLLLQILELLQNNYINQKSRSSIYLSYLLHVVPFAWICRILVWCFVFTVCTPDACQLSVSSAVISEATLSVSSWSGSKNRPLYLHISDQRVRGMLLLDNYIPTFALTVIYLLIVWLGPKYMKHRQPYSCRGPMVLYNLGLTLLSVYMFYEVNKLLSTDRRAVGRSNTSIKWPGQQLRGRYV